MTWHDDPNHPFAGIAERLRRADESLANLHQEIIQFFERSKFPIIPYENEEKWQEAVEYHRDLPIPIRFGVLSGEIVHHMRSCLDHIAWHFSSDTYRRTHETAILFPVLKQRPTKPDDIRRYDRNISGITNSNVKDLIERLQPYHRGNDAINHPLCVIHDMDRCDKHRELAIVASCVNLTLPDVTEMADVVAALRYAQGESLSPSEMVAAERTFKSKIKASPQVAFVQFGNRKTQSVVPSLQQLQSAIDNVVSLFANEV